MRVHPYDWTSRHQLATILRLAGNTEEAERQLPLARRGKEIEKEIKNLGNAGDASGDLLEKLAQYAADSGGPCRSPTPSVLVWRSEPESATAARRNTSRKPLHWVVL